MLSSFCLILCFPLQVFDNKNPYLAKSDEYAKQMKNLKWLLGAPFQITSRIDIEYLHFNDAKDDLRDDALKRDAFFAAAHTAVALDVMRRMAPGATPMLFCFSVRASLFLPLLILLLGLMS